jgi:flagella basal body P-ring formation protein FlgA
VLCLIGITALLYASQMNEFKTELTCAMIVAAAAKQQQQQQTLHNAVVVLIAAAAAAATQCSSYTGMISNQLEVHEKYDD